MTKLLRCCLLIMAITLCYGCEAQVEMFPVLFKSSSKLKDPYGLCTHISRKGIVCEFDSKDKDLSMTNRLGANYVRTDFDWGNCQPQKKQSFSFAHHQEMMDVVDSQQLKMLGILSPVWDNRYTPWLEYVGRTVRTFKSQVRYWEVLNEADRWHLKDSDFKPSDYVRIIRDAYPLIKRENKNAKVLFTSITDVKGIFFKEVLDSGSAKYCDIMNFHFYVNNRTEPEYLFNYFKEISSILDKYKIRKPVWFTETGCTTAEGFVDEDTQARRLPRVYLISFACGIEKVFWYKSRACELSENYEDHFGIWHKDYSPKPAFYAYKTIVKMCPSGSTRPQITRVGSVYVAKWKKKGKKCVTAVWTSDKNISVGVEPFEGDIYDIYGKRETMNERVLNASPSILYFVGKNHLKVIEP